MSKVITAIFASSIFAIVAATGANAAPTQSTSTQIATNSLQSAWIRAEALGD